MEVRELTNSMTKLSNFAYLLGSIFVYNDSLIHLESSLKYAYREHSN